MITLSALGSQPPIRDFPGPRPPMRGPDDTARRPIQCGKSREGIADRSPRARPAHGDSDLNLNAGGKSTWVTAPRGTRTHNLRFRRPALYPIELAALRRKRPTTSGTQRPEAAARTLSRFGLVPIVPGTGVEPARGINLTRPSTWRVCQFRHPGSCSQYTGFFRPKTRTPRCDRQGRACERGRLAPAFARRSARV